MSDIKLKIWNLKLPDHFSMIIYGSRRCGKSTIARYIFEKNNLNEKYDFIICMSKNNDALSFMSEYVSSKFFINRFDGQMIKNIIDISQHLEKKAIHKNFLIILDDTNCNEAKNNEALKDIYSMGRHLNCSIIWMTQHVTNISPDSRNNGDLYIIGNMQNAIEKKTLIENFFMGLRDEDDALKESEYKFYRQLIKKYTCNYKFIVIDGTSLNNEFYDKVKYILAK
jgi:AAA+ ATPase superfamily predicted ATPase